MKNSITQKVMSGTSSGPSGTIDKPFLSLLKSYKVSSATYDVLQEEQILSLETFISLEEHFSLLAKKLRVGYFATFVAP